MPLDNNGQPLKFRYNIRARMRALETSQSVEMRDLFIQSQKIDRSTYYKWLKISDKDFNDIPGRALRAFAQMFNCSIEDLFTN